jgi:hypothetical protein
MDSSRLSPLQRDLLDAFFAQTDRFFLTGGAALAAFYLGHRQTKDLDLFATPEVDMEEGVRALRLAASNIGASLQVLQESPDFRRFSVERAGELTLVDLVIDRAPQLIASKPSVGRIRIDSLREIAANKLCAIISRNAPRDLVDLKLLLDQGLRLEDVLADAQQKDAGADPATLAWVLSDLKIGPHVPIPGDLTADQLNQFREELIQRFARMALPAE